MTEPTHGWTKLGHAVHAKTLDHLPMHNAYARFNKRVALALTKYVGTMTAFWLFGLLALCSLPAVLNGFTIFHGVFPHWLVTASLIALVAWISSNFLQLILLPALLVGQNLQNIANDARSTKQFEDTEIVVDRLDEHTAGGIKTILDRLDAMDNHAGR